MPEIRRYRVTQTRVVEVAANTEVDAVRIADAAFTHGQNTDLGVANGKGPEGVWGNTTNWVKTILVEAERI